MLFIGFFLLDAGGSGVLLVAASDVSPRTQKTISARYVSVTTALVSTFEITTRPVTDNLQLFRETRRFAHFVCHSVVLNFVR